MTSTADSATGGAEDRQDGTDDEEDDADRGENGDLEQEPCDDGDDPENDHVRAFRSWSFGRCDHCQSTTLRGVAVHP